LVWDGQAPVHFVEEHDMHDFLNPDCAMQFSFSVTFGHPIQHSLVSAESQVTTSMTHQPLRCDQGMHCLHFFNAAGGWWQE
jgi:hypothetical protein